MIKATTPNGTVFELVDGATAYDLSVSISKSLAKKALLAKVNDELWDLHRTLPHDCHVTILTRDDDEVLATLRHDCAHVLAEAVQEIFPNTQITFGPAIEYGFYYDFHREMPFTPDDFVKIEEKMHEIIKKDEKFVREVMPRDKAVSYFKEIGEDFKAEHIASIPANEEITIYTQGSWKDMCRGPHLPSTGKIGKAFKLMKLSGSYWKADSNNAQLQRIYGACFLQENDLKDYLHTLEEAEKRDHRKLGKQLEYFHFQEEAPGGVFWHEKGWRIHTILEQYMRARLDKENYKEIKTPQLVDRVLWEKSGHWEKFREHMFVAEVDESSSQTYDTSNDEGESSHKRIMALKPMNCPCHVQVFKQGIKSYRDLPLRLSEYGSCHRYEPSGALHGLMRVRAFTQDDGHIFCTEDQIVEECQNFCSLLLSIYKDLGFDDVKIKFSDRPEKRAGTDQTWDHAENALKKAIETTNIAYTINPGEGAFYGPKLEYVLRDAIGRDWQCGTFQVDFVLPERLDAHYIAEDGSKKRPVMLHRAILGSFERFIGILLENYAARLPLWLAPEQIAIATITSDVDDYAMEVKKLCEAANLRVKLDTRNEKINYKIREHSQNLIPAIFVIGNHEQKNKEVAIRRLGGKAQNILSLDKAIKIISNEAQMPTI